MVDRFDVIRAAGRQRDPDLPAAAEAGRQVAAIEEGEHRVGVGAFVARRDDVFGAANAGELIPVHIADRREGVVLLRPVGAQQAGATAHVVRLVGVALGAAAHADIEPGQVILLALFADAVIAIDPGIDDVVAARGCEGVIGVGPTEGRPRTQAEEPTDVAGIWGRRGWWALRRVHIEMGVETIPKRGCPDVLDHDRDRGGLTGRWAGRIQGEALDGQVREGGRSCHLGRGGRWRRRPGHAGRGRKTRQRVRQGSRGPDVAHQQRQAQQQEYGRAQRAGRDQ